jgi:uncharacterized protein YprB with RNaseH-like and TPR domain
MVTHVPVFFDIETTGFNPLTQEWYSNADYGAQVTAIGIGRMDDEFYRGGGYVECSNQVLVLYDSSEYRLLQIAHKRLEEIIGDYQQQGYEPFLTTFNGRRFDHPYLGARYSRLRLDGSWFTHRAKRLDMMRAFGKHYDGVGRYPSEDDCLEAVGIDSDDEYDGSDMPDAFGNKEWGKISDHVEADTEEMVKLFCAEPEICMEEFFDHYDINQDAEFNEEVSY